jgi:hypothetical protein
MNGMQIYSCGNVCIVRENPRYSVGISSVKKGSEISHLLAGEESG